MTDENPNKIDEEAEEEKEEKEVKVTEPILENQNDNPEKIGDEKLPQSTFPETSVYSLDMIKNSGLVLIPDEELDRYEEEEEKQVAIVEPSASTIPEGTNLPARKHPEIATDGHLNTIDEENEDEVDEPPAPVVEQTVIHHSIRDNNPPQIRTAQHVTNVSARKQCIVCLDYITNTQRGIQPCPCGYWVHNHCLMTGIQTYEADHPGCAPLGCRFCMVAYMITPRKTTVLRLMSKIYQRYGQLCEIGNYVVAMVFVDSTFTIIGFTVLMKIYGQKEAEDMLISMEPIKAAAICKAIPVFSILINAIPWETKLLRFLRRCSKLPVVGKLFPCYDPRVREMKHRRTFFGVLIGGLLLPWYANMFGIKLFSSVQSRLARFLLGGVTCLAIKGSLQMYYRQRLYARQCFLAVEAYQGEGSVGSLQ